LALWRQSRPAARAGFGQLKQLGRRLNLTSADGAVLPGEGQTSGPPAASKVLIEADDVFELRFD